MSFLVFVLLYYSNQICQTTCFCGIWVPGWLNALGCIAFFSPVHQPFRGIILKAAQRKPMHSMTYLEHVTRLCAGVLPLLMRSVAVERLSAALPDPSDLPLVMEDKCFSHERPAGCVCTMGDLVLL